MNINNILKLLPHRFPFVMVDRIICFEYDKKAVGIKNISANEPWNIGHFPTDPVFPGALHIEAMGQVGGFIFHNNQNKLKAYLCGVDKVKFLKTLVPGDTVEIEAVIVARVGNMARVDCTSRVNNEIVAKGVISYAFDENS